MLDAPKKAGATGVTAGPPTDFQQHLANLEAQGLVVRVDRPINKDTELHPLVRWQFAGGLPEDQRRAFLFTNVVGADGRKFDMPVVVGALAASARIYSLGMGKPVEEIEQAWSNAIANPIPPVRVASAPCQEVVIKGDDLRGPGKGLAALPVPISTPGYDVAPYITATLAVTRDPENGIQNMGTYRGQLKATDRMGVRMAARIGGAGGYQHWLKHRKAKTPMPIAFAIGAAPVVMFTGPMKLPIDLDEMAVAGGLAGAPIRTVKCVTVDLDVPADAEIVIEGLIDPELLEPEAPFGESHGHIALEEFNMSMQVTAITHKRKPVLASIISEVTPSESSLVKRLAYEPMYLVHLRDRLSIKGVRRVVMHEPLVEPPQDHLRAMRARHAAQRSLARPDRRGHACSPTAARSASPSVRTSIRPTPMRYSGRSATARTRWTTCTCCHIARADMVRKRASAANNSTLLIDATLKVKGPPLALPTREFMENAKKIWDELKLPALTPQSPWHGYSLGEWGDDWETFAQRAVRGEWEANGLDSFARRRSDVMPETPVRDVEGKKK